MQWGGLDVSTTFEERIQVAGSVDDVTFSQQQIAVLVVERPREWFVRAVTH